MSILLIFDKIFELIKSRLTCVSFRHSDQSEGGGGKQISAIAENVLHKEFQWKTETEIWDNIKTEHMEIVCNELDWSGSKVLSFKFSSKQLQVKLTEY
jgi:hypothetical protein